MSLSPPQGITPPTPGSEREEPEIAYEADVPSDDGTVNDLEPDAEQRPRGHAERE